MSMSTLSRRLQILIDEERFARVELDAAAAGVSVGEYVRRALDAAAERSRGPARQQAVVEELLRAPRMSVDAGELRELIDEAHGDSPEQG